MTNGPSEQEEMGVTQDHDPGLLYSAHGGPQKDSKEEQPDHALQMRDTSVSSLVMQGATH